MSLISVERYENAKVHTIEVKKDLWVSVKAVKNGLGVKNMSDLALKEIYGRYEKKKLTKEKIKCYKMTEREIFEKFGKLSNDELAKLCNKSVFVRNTIMTSIIKNCKGEKKRGIRSAEGLREKLLIPDNEIYESIEHKVKSKIGTIFASEDTLEEYSVQIYEIDLYFSEHYEKKYKLIVTVSNIYCLELIFILLSSRN